MIAYKISIRFPAWATRRAASSGRRVLLLVVVALALYGFGHTRTARATAAPSHAQPIVFVALGGSHTVGLGSDHPATDCYPALLARHLPRGARYLNLAGQNVSAQAALTSELPKALAAHPTLATVWLGINEVVHGVPPATYRQTLVQLLSALQRARARVFVATMPDPMWIPIGFVAQKHNQDAARAYNAVIADEAAHYGAIVVDVYGASKALWGNPQFVAGGGSLLSPAGFLLNTRGYAALARVFYRVMHHHGAL